jgi:hypothetical protein
LAFNFTAAEVKAQKKKVLIELYGNEGKKGFAAEPEYSCAGESIHDNIICCAKHIATRCDEQNNKRSGVGGGARECYKTLMFRVLFIIHISLVFTRFVRC